MQTDVGVIEASASIRELERRLAEGKVSGFPVLRGGVVAGVVSRADVVERLGKRARPGDQKSSYYVGIESFEAEEILATFAEIGRRSQTAVDTLRVEDVMTPWVVAVAPDASLQEVARSLLHYRVHRVLVIEGEKLVGLISSLDFVRRFAEGPVRPAASEEES